MDTKLTLKLDSNVIELSKVYAKEQGKSLLSIVEDYLRSLLGQSDDAEMYDISPELASLVGVATIGDDDSVKAEYLAYMEAKSA